MEPEAPKHTTTATEARQGQTMNMGRWVLILGLILVIIGFAVAWFLIRE